MESLSALLPSVGNKCVLVTRIMMDDGQYHLVTSRDSTRTNKSSIASWFPLLSPPTSISMYSSSQRRPGARVPLYNKTLNFELIQNMIASFMIA